MKPWEEKAHKLVTRLCHESYLQANTAPSGRLFNVPVRYTVPVIAEELINCLVINDEETAKAVYLKYYGKKLVD